MIPNQAEPAQVSRAARRLAALLALSSSFTATVATAQSPAPEAAKEEEAIELPAFTVEVDEANPYRANQATSSSRVAMPIQDIPQSISVVTSELINDTMGQRMLDVAKYITPVVESTLPVGGDRYMIRGFQVSHEFVDGIEISGADGYSASLAPYNIERVEIIKGPNAILVPGGSPGGQMNPITKSPMLKNKASATVDVAQYYGTGASTDINRVLSEKNGLAARLVSAVWRSDGYIQGQYRHGWMVAPSVLLQLSPQTKIIVKGEIMQNRESTISGLPIDPAIGSLGYAKIARGLPRDFSFGNEADSRHRGTERITLEVHNKLGDHVTSRLQVVGNHVLREDFGGTSAAISGPTGSRNPNTGLFEPGITWALNQTGATAVATSTVTGIPDPSLWTYTRNTTRVYLDYLEAHIKNEYAARFENRFFKSTTIGGFGANSSKVHFKSWPSAGRPSVPASQLSGITFPDYNWTEPVVGNGTNRVGKHTDLHLFLFETASFWKDRVNLSAGISRYHGSLAGVQDATNSTAGFIGQPRYPEYSLSDTAHTLGVVIKPIKEVSLFYGYNTSGGTMPGSLGAGTYAPGLKVADGNQKEYGVKTTLLDGKLNASFAYFDIQQKNYPVPNSDYYTLVAQGAVIPADFPTTLYLDLNSKGWEVEGSYSLNKNLTIMGNFTKFRIRQPITNVRVRAVPDQSAGMFVDYRFDQGFLKNFGISVGADYKDDVVGENATGYTTTKPLANGTFVPVQPTFLVAGRTLVNVGIAYRAKVWTARVMVKNALDKDYIMAAGSRTSAVVGDPRNISASFTYNF